jgi:hypothetical protein
MISRSRPDRLATRPSSAASRAPARPARASAIPVSVRASGGVRRARRAVSPSICSANVTAGQSGLAQKNRRTASRITTRWPPTGASARRRWYALCTRAENRAAPGARSGFRTGTRPDAQLAARQLRGFDDSSGQVRQQPLQADFMLA